jgi:hypothetical protein
MKKIILTITGSALLVLSTAQLSAAERHHVRHRNVEFRDTNAYVAPAFSATESEASRYSYGWSAPAGR